MGRRDFDTLTDWVGIPLAVLLLVLLALVDAGLIGRRPPRRSLTAGVVVVMAAAVGLFIARFAYLA